MRQNIKINSQLDALKVKEVEKIFYENIGDNTKLISNIIGIIEIQTKNNILVCLPTSILLKLYVA